VGAFQQGQQRGRQANLMGSLASGAPREQVLQDLSYVDPMLAGREQGIFTSGQARETDAQRQQKRLAEAGPLRMEAVALANKIRQSLSNPDYDPQEDFGKYKLLESEYFTASNGKKLDVDLFTLTEEARKQGKFGMDKEKLGMDKTEFKQKTIDRFRKEWVSTIDVLKNIPKIRTFANQAKKGNQVGFQNLLKSVSRMGSNEALSDSERDALKSGNLGDQFQAFFNRMFGSGVDASPKDVTALLALIDDMMPRLMGQAEANYKAEEADLVADTGASAQEVRRRALKGIPTKWAPVMGAVSGFKEKEKSGGTSGSPSTATAPSSDSDFDAIANMLKGR
jgi:hypothetical protein